MVLPHLVQVHTASNKSIDLTAATKTIFLLLLCCPGAFFGASYDKRRVAINKSHE